MNIWKPWEAKEFFSQLVRFYTLVVWIKLEMIKIALLFDFKPSKHYIPMILIVLLKIGLLSELSGGSKMSV